MEDFRTLFLEKIHADNLKSLDKMFASSHVCHLKKGEVFLKQGEYQKEGAFLLTGCVKKYFLTSSGKVCIEDFVTKSFWPAASCSLNMIAPIQSFTTVEAVTDTKLMLCPLEVMKLAAGDQKIVVAYNRMCNEMVMQSREFKQVLEKPTPERYKWVLSQKKEILQWISQKELAQYLNMTPERLSAIKKKLFESKEA